jgi:hypothetical protein
MSCSSITVLETIDGNLAECKLDGSRYQIGLENVAGADEFGLSGPPMGNLLLL